MGSTDTPKMKIAVAATFTAEPLLRTLNFWGEKLRWNAVVEFAPYNQVFQQLLDPGSLFGGNSQGANILLVRPEDWLRYESSGAPVAKEKLHQSRQDLISAVRSSAQRSTVPHFVYLCPASPNTELKNEIRLEEHCIYSDLQNVPGIEVFTSHSLLAAYTVSDYYDPERDKMAHIPYTEEFFAALGTLIARKLHVRQQPPYKVIAVDCDETLWTGVCGEVGATGIEIGSHRKHLQEFLVRQQEAGMLLCLCSKNNPEDVEEVFQRRPDMPLKREHITASRINWQPKAENLRALAAELQLGLDSFIFIDDNPLECGQVKASCPEVLTLELPQAPQEIPMFLANVWAFDRQKLTEEDRRRSASYRQNRERDEFQRQAPSLESFLSGLQLEIDISPMAEAEIVRVAQLTQRTNQFNCTTVRRTEDAVRRTWASGELEYLTVRVKDRFGDYGLVGSMLARRVEKALEVDTFLLSCRVLGRGVEHRMLAALGRLAQSRSLSRVDVRFVSTKKNGPALSFLESVAGEFKAADEAGFWFRIPSEYAARLSERQILCTLRVAAEKVEQQSEEAGGTSMVVADSQLMQDIATRFNTPAAILAAIQKGAAEVPAAGSSDGDNVESTIIHAWSQALGTDQITGDADFFALGGDSLPAVQVIIQLNQAFDISLALQDVFEHPTVKSLAEAIRKAVQEKQGVVADSQSGHTALGDSTDFSEDSRTADESTLQGTPSRSNIEGRKDLSPCPLSFAQESWWVMNEWAPNSPDLSSCVLQIKGKLDIDAMQRTLSALVDRHEALRTTFEATESGPVQFINSRKISIELPIVDLRPLKDRAEQRAEQIIEEESVKPFNLGSDLMLRPTLLRIGDNDHILILIAHHIAFDAFSREILLQEFEVLYRAFADGKKNPLPPLSRQYADYAVWQRNIVSSGALQGQLEYWKQRLAGIPTRIELPRTRNAANAQLSRGMQHSTCLPSETADALRALARREGVTLFMLLLGAFQTLLHRYSAQDDIVVGSAEVGRSHPHTESIVGCFVNVLPLRTDLSGNPTFRELLTRVRETVLQARSNQDVPLPRLIQELAPGRNMSQAPLFQALFSLEKPLVAPEIPGLDITARELDTRTALYDILLFAALTPQGLRLNFEWNKDLFEGETIERMSQHFRTLLTSIAENADESVDSLNMLPQAERRRLLVEWNDTHVEYPTTVSLISLIEKQVERTPDAIALVCNSERLNYAELNARANQLARHLRSVGVGPDVLAGVCLERSVEMVISLLAILKAGGAYVPFDPDYPQRRLQQMLDDAKPPVLLSVSWLLSRLPESASNVLCLDRDGNLFEHQDKSNLPGQIGGENLAYAIYTSGSTGIPKGVPNTHKGIVNRLLWMQDAFQLTSKDKVLQKTPYSFDVSVWEFFWPLLTGATLVMARPGGHKDPAYLVDLIAEEKITTLHFVPSMLSIFLESEGLDRCTSLKQVFASGEALLPEMQQRFFEQLRAKLHNLYGPTEAAVDVTYWTCTPSTKLASIPIGRPIANIQIYILDRFLQPVPVGIAGELHIGGIGLARGYLNRPELTAEKFIQNPYGKPGDRLYKTGDLARFLPDGNVEYLGRIDQQVKVRGFRIELGEIESVLEEHPDVVQAVVVARNEGGGEKSLLACIVPKIFADAPANSFLLPNGIRVAHQNKNETEYLYKEIFESQTYFQHGIELTEGACVFDVGANIGLFTLYVSQKCAGARIYAFEPIPPVFENLKANASLCQAEVHPFPIGLSSQETVAQFTHYPLSSIMSRRSDYASKEEEMHLLREFLGNYQEDSEEAQLLAQSDEFLAHRFASQKYDCTLRRLSDIVREEKVSYIDLLKIDVERSELDVLAGIDPEHWAIIGQVVIEVHYVVAGKSGGRVNQVSELLQRHGFVVTIEEIQEMKGTGLFSVSAQKPARRTSPGTQAHELIANLTPVSQPKPITPAQLRMYLQARLPEYMVPAAFTMLKQIPMTSSGKADRRALLEMNFAPVEREVVYIPPRTPLEEEVANVWKEVLGLTKVGINENFFEIGGHSLKATKVIMLLRNKLGINVSLRLLFEHATISEMSEALMHLLLDQAEEPAVEEMLNEVESLSDNEIGQLRAGDAGYHAVEIEQPLPSPAGTRRQ